MTSLDKYSIINIFYLFIICVWHSIGWYFCKVFNLLLFSLSITSFIVGTFWEKERAITIDRIFLCIFGFIFIIIQLIYGIWMYSARARVRVLDKEEKKFLFDINKKIEQL